MKQEVRSAERKSTRAVRTILAALALTLALVSVANAERGVLGYHQFKGSFNPAGAGEFSAVQGVAVNGAGVGGASPGDVYVLENGDFGARPRIQQFSASGVFQRLWGLDVVASGPGNSSETQALTIPATAGTFTLTFGNETTDPILFDAAPSVVKAELDGLGSVGGVGGSMTVAGGPGDAGGTGPYLITFGGAQANVNEPLIAVNGSSLTGGVAPASIVTTNPGAVGFEVCRPANGDICKRALPGGTISLENELCGGVSSTSANIAINSATGNLYVVGKSRVNVFSATGQCLGAIGFDVVGSGPHDSNVNERQKLIVTATGGTYTLSMFIVGGGTATTAPIAYDATAEEVEDALIPIGAIGGLGGSVDVNGGPTGPGDPGPYEYTIDFQGTLGGDDVSQFSSSIADLLGPGKNAAITTVADGGALEACTTDDSCRRGGSGPYAISQSAGHVAIAPPGAPNAGTILVPDGSNNRIVEFTSAGAFVRAIGWDVIAPGSPGNVMVNEVQVATVEDATGGTFTFRLGGFAQTTALSPSASAAAVDTALEALPAIGAGNVAVSGPSGGPWQIEFVGELATVDVGQIEALYETLTGAGARVVVATATPGGGFEVCVPESGDTCKVGGVGSAVGQLSSALQGATVDSDGAIYTVESSSFGSSPPIHRVQKFTPAGGLALTPSLFGTTEVQELTVNASAGEFRLTAVDSDGTLGSGTLTPGSATVTDVTKRSGAFAVGQPIYGGEQIQLGTKIVAVGPGTITMSQPAIATFVNSSGLTSTDLESTGNISHDAPPSVVAEALNALPAINGGAIGIGNLTAGSTSVNNVTILQGAFASGQPISGQGIAPGTKVQGVSFSGSPGLSQPATETVNGVELVATGGRSVSVSGGPGDPGGNSPYEIAFSGGRLAHSDPGPLAGSSGSEPLSGGTGVGANEANVVTTVPGGPSGAGSDETPVAIATGPNDEVFVAKRYPGGHPICADGSFEPAEHRIQELTSAGAVVEVSKPCTIHPDTDLSLNQRLISNVPFGGLAVNSVSEDLYLLHQIFPNPRLYAFGEVGADPDLALDPVSGLSASGATVSGAVDPNGPPGVNHPNPSATTYRVEYKKTSESTWTLYAPDVSVGSGLSPVPFSVGVSGLEPKTEYQIRVTASKPWGFESVTETTSPFTTLAAPPTIAALFSSNVTAMSADLHALVNPRGTATTFHFEYGKTPAYGQSTPETPVGEQLSPQPVQAHIEGLENVVYHFRVVATNSEGSTASTDQTFTFYPEPCPNASVRQQTGSGSLPDCRAYELVSPANARTALLFPGGPPAPEASNPARVSFLGAASSIPGPWNPQNGFGDLYVATRESTGWQTNFVGVPADLASQTSGHPLDFWLLADSQLSEVLQWFSLGAPNGGGENASQGEFYAPYVFDWQGSNLGRRPTNLAEVPGADKGFFGGGFFGDINPSADFDHYVFSSANFAFAPGGLTTGAGSVYDNLVDSGSVEIVSKLPNGSDIPQGPGNSGNFLRIPAVSSDGSHILMGGNSDRVGVLYMRVDGAVSYAVSRGQIVKFEGMTADGEEVYFTSDEQLPGGNDTDASTDLYRWSRATDTLTRVSDGPGSVGSTDGCNATWTELCGVEVVATSGDNGLLNESLAKPTDNALAAGSGDTLFYSPEQFVGSNGVPGRRNLYLSRDGQFEYIATLDATKPVTRVQLSPDGRHLAFITASRLTTYDNAGFEQMYTYDTETDDLRCVSCQPSGAPPGDDVEGSDNGLFMSDDGRAFFDTTDALVPRDTNGLNDVYEFVDGRPQLITTGLGGRDDSIFGQVGLVGVSANGIDVHFWTLEPLVSNDANGGNARFYTARTNGGFLLAPQVAPCKAADECHGASAGDIPTPRVSSTASLATGNAPRKRCRPHGKRASAQSRKKAKRCRAAKRHTRHNRGSGR
jgi:hypothetical protein